MSSLWTRARCPPIAKWTPMKPEAKDSAVAVKRRRFSEDFRRGLVQRTLMPGASVAKIALEHQLNANLLFKWRRWYLCEIAGRATDAPQLLPVNVEQVSSATEPKLLAAGGSTRSGAAAAGSMEIELACGRIRLQGAVDIETLRSVLQILANR